MKFSIVVPVYNVEKYVEDALKSLLLQDYDDYEVIIIDDGSTDGSSGICLQFSKLDDRFKYFKQVNQGLSVARNEGLSKATGEYVYFFDSDDMLAKGSLSSWAADFQKHDVDAILFEAEVFTDEDTDYRPEYTRNVEGSALYESDDYIAESVANNFYFSQACCYVVKKDALDTLKFYPSIIHEDELFYFELFAAKRLSLLVQNKKFFKRRVRVGSIMTAANINKRVCGYVQVLYGCLRVQDKIAIKSINAHLNNLLAVVVRLSVEELKCRKAFFLSFQRRSQLIVLYYNFLFVAPFNWRLLLKVLFPELSVNVISRCKGYLKKSK